MAFEMPFVFPTMRSIIDLQQSHIGHAGLSTMSEQGMTGLVYLNAGVTLVAGSGELKSPYDLKGRKIAVDSQAQFQSVQKLGSSPVRLRPGDVRMALKSGSVDSTVINASDQDTWKFSDGGFLLTDSVQGHVAVVVTHDATWERIPFVYRAMIGDTAIAVSQRFDQILLKVEGLLHYQAQWSKVSLVNFQAKDAERATLRWISMQPEAQRGIYSSVYNYVKNKNLPSPRNPLSPRQDGQVGRFYFATTRNDTGQINLSYRFGDLRTNVIKCGEIEYFRANPRRTMTVVGAVRADSVACGTYLNAVLQSSSRMLIFVHGFANRFSDAAEKAIMLKNTLFNGTEVMLWSWPSKRDGIAGNLGYDKESVGGVARQSFKRLLKALQAGSRSVPLNILAHSMGGWHTVGVLQDLSDDGARPTLHNVVLAAPDVPRDEFVFALEDMHRAASRVTLYACAWDWALALSQEINGYPRAGTGGHGNIVVNDKLESIDVDARLLSTNHSYVFEVGKVLDDLTVMVVSNNDAGVRGLLQKQKAPWHYWRFP